MRKYPLFFGIAIMAAIIVAIVFLSMAWFSSSNTKVNSTSTRLIANASGVTIALNAADYFLDEEKPYCGQSGLGLTLQSGENVDENAPYIYEVDYDISSEIADYKSVLSYSVFTLEYMELQITHSNGEIENWLATDVDGETRLENSLTWRVVTNGETYGPNTDVSENGDGSAYGFRLRANSTNTLSVQIIFLGETAYNRYCLFLNQLGSGEEPTYYDFGSYTDIFVDYDQGVKFYYAYELDEYNQYVMVDAEDENGDPVYETDINGDPIFETDINGDPILDENGDPVPKVLKVHSIVYFSPYSTEPTTDQKWHSIILQDGLVGTELCDYHYIGSTLKIKFKVSLAEVQVPWDGVLTADLSGMTYLTDGGAVPYAYIWYTDESLNAHYPGLPMTSIGDGKYTIQTNTDKRIEGVIIVRANEDGTYMYNKTGNITSIPSNHTITLTDANFTEIARNQRTAYNAISVHFDSSADWFFNDGYIPYLYVWYTDSTDNNGFPGQEMMETADSIYGDNHNIYVAIIDPNKTIAGFKVTRAKSQNDYQNQSNDYNAAPPSSRMIQIYTTNNDYVLRVADYN